MATHSSIFAWKIPWTEEPCGLQSMGMQRIGHNWATDTQYRSMLFLLFSHPVMSNSLQPHGLHHTRPSCPSPSPGVGPNSYPLHQGCHLAISSFDALLYFCPQTFPASGTFPVSWLFISDDQNTGASVSVSIFSMSVQGLFPLRLTGLISLLSKGLSGLFSSTTVGNHQFFGVPLSFSSSSHNHTWPLERP